MTTIADGLKDVFLAGVGAMALGAREDPGAGGAAYRQGRDHRGAGQGHQLRGAETGSGHRRARGPAGQTAVGEAGREAQAAASHLNDPGQDGRGVGSRADRGAVSMARSQAEMAADAVKKATEGAKKDSADFATALKHDVLEAQMAMMTPEQRASSPRRPPKSPPAMRKRNSWQEILPRSSSFRNRKRNPHVAGSFP